MSLISAAELADLFGRHEIKRTVVLIKKQKPFYTRLENFAKPPNTCLIGLFGKAIQNSVDPAVAMHFDFIKYLDFPDSKEADFMAPLPKAIEETVASVCSTAVTGTVRLIETEDALLFGVAKLREQFGILGPKVADLHPFIDKEKMKSAVVSHSIPTAKYLVLDFKMPLESLKQYVHAFLANVEFPLFKKPIHGDGSRGSGKIANKAELFHWIECECLNGNKEKFLLEQFVESHAEFWASVLINADSSITPHMVVKFNAVGVPIHTGKPIRSICRTFEGYADEFPGMLEFVERVIKALKPSAGNNFVVQGFQKHPMTNEYIFTECSYRQGGPSSAMSFVATGLSVETAILSILLNTEPNFRVLSNPHLLDVQNAAQIRWPTKTGVLIEKNAPIGVKSELKMNWKYEIGEQITQATFTTNFTVMIQLTNPDQTELEKEVNDIATNWEPKIV